VLHDPSAFEPLTEDSWDEARVRDQIVADAAFDFERR
jgi:hypothetical protein